MTVLPYPSNITSFDNDRLKSKAASLSIRRPVLVLPPRSRPAFGIGTKPIESVGFALLNVTIVTNPKIKIEEAIVVNKQDSMAGTWVWNGLSNAPEESTKD